ncbi:MAG: prepilin-type N-terminal cleavage/methylation domain-containing protein [Candidatus Omnitrophota bacterium]
MISKTGNDCYKKRKVNLFNSKPAFTLLELLLTIGIIAVVLAMTFPFIQNNIKNVFFTSFVNRAYLFLDYAKSKAVLKNAPLAVSFDLERKTFFLFEAGQKESGDMKLKVPEAITLSMEKEEIHFYPDGTLEEFSLVISDNRGRSVSCRSSGFDGKIYCGENEK